MAAMVIPAALTALMAGKAVWDTASSIYNFSSLSPAQRQQMELQQEWQEKMRATQYQTTVEDMKKAGLNPALLYGNAMAQSQTPSNGSILPTHDHPDSVNALGQFILDMKMKESNIKLQDAQSENLLADAEGKRIENAYKGQLRESEIASNYADVDYKNASTDLQKAMVDKTNAEIDKFMSDIELNQSNITYNQSKIANLAADSALKNIDTQTKMKMLPYIDDLQEASIALMSAQADEAYAKVDELFTQIEKIESETALNLFNLEGLGVLKEKTNGEWMYKEWKQNRNSQTISNIKSVAGSIKDIGIGIGGAAAGIKGGLVVRNDTKGTTTTNTYDGKGKLKGTTQTYSSSQSNTHK